MEPIRFRAVHVALGMSVCIATQVAFPQGTGGPSIEERTPPGSKSPPQKEAIDACTGKAEGDRVRFVDAKGKSRHWTCVTTDGVMAARSGIGTPARKIPAKPSA